MFLSKYEPLIDIFFFFQDSLTAEDFHWSPGLAMVNKNNYTLTFSGHGSISSHVEFGSSPHHQLQLHHSKSKPSNFILFQF